MKRTLEDYLAKGYNSPKRIKVDEVIVTGDYSLCDSKACVDAQRLLEKAQKKVCPDDCQKVMAQIHVASHSGLIHLEELITKQLPRIKTLNEGGVCDILVSNKNAIVFIELSCTLSHYLDKHQQYDKEVPGKRQKAKNQLVNTIDKLNAVNDIKVQISKYSVKRTIFAYRQKDEVLDNTLDNQVLMQMMPFDSFHLKAVEDHMILDLSNGFTFEEIRYPEVVNI